MNRFARVAVVLSALSLGATLTGCDTFDPTDIFSSDMFSTKRKLAGERRPVFPEGTPGVDAGRSAGAGQRIPAPSEPEPAQAQAEEPKAKPKPKPKTVTRPLPAEPDEPATSGTVRPAQAQRPDSPTQRQQPQRPQAATGGWPGSPQPQGQVAWPDPPAPGTFSR